MERALSLAKNSPYSSLHLQACLNAVIYYVWKGDFEACTIIVNDAKKILASRAAPPIYLIGMKAAKAYFFASVGESERPLELVSEGLELAAKTGIHIMDFWLVSYGVLSALNKGDRDLIARYLGDEKSGLGTVRRIPHVIYYHQLSWFNLLFGNLFDAGIYAKKAVALARESGVPVGEAWSRLGLAEALFGSGDYVEALEELANAEKISTKTGSLILEFVCGIIRADFAFTRGEEASGLKALQKTFALGRRTGYVLALGFWLSSVWSRLCSKALEADIEAEYTKGIIKKLGLVPDDFLAADENWPWPLKVYTLGKFEIIKNGDPVFFTGKVQQKPLEMLKALIALGGEGISEGQLTDALWPEAEGDAAHVSFNTTLHRLRKLIENEKTIQLREGRVTLDRKHCWVDVWAFERVLGMASGPKKNRGGKPSALSQYYNDRERHQYLQGAVSSGGQSQAVVCIHPRAPKEQISIVYKGGLRAL